jgi:DNA-binding response OmpR family regulator
MTAENQASSTRKLREDNFDAVVMDISLPGKSGLEVLREFKDTGERDTCSLNKRGMP